MDETERRKPGRKAGVPPMTTQIHNLPDGPADNEGLTPRQRKILEFIPNDADAIQFLGPQVAAAAAAAPRPPAVPPPRPQTPMPAQVPAWPRYLLLLQLVWVYFSGGMNKSAGAWGPFGGFTALANALSDPHAARFAPGWVGAIYPLTRIATGLEPPTSRVFQ